jgi:hypothetical protein
MEIVLKNCSANDAVDIVQELRSMNLTQGKDFDFSFTQSRWDEMIGEIPKQTLFKFYDIKWASLFALKYGHRYR